MNTRFVSVCGLVAFAVVAAVALAAEPCAYRGKLDALYCDENRDLVADPPKDPAKLVSPDPLIFTYAPVEDPADRVVGLARSHVTRWTARVVGSMGEGVMHEIQGHAHRRLTLLRRVVVDLFVLQAVPEVGVVRIEYNQPSFVAT